MTARPGDGEYFINWLHLDDIVSAIDFVFLQAVQKVYNLVDVPWITRNLERASVRTSRSAASNFLGCLSLQPTTLQCLCIQS